MKHLKLFFALFAMLALGVTNAWGAEETFDWSSVTTTQQNLTSANVYTEGSVTLTFAKASGSNWPAENKEGSIRMYSNTTLTISCASGNITKVVFTSTGNSYTAANLKYNGTALSGNEWTLSSPANEVLLTASANARFEKIVVTYETASGGGETPGEGGGENSGEGEEPETPSSQSTATLIVGENGGVTWTNGAKTANATVGDVVFTALGSGSNDSKYYSSDKSWRFYTANTSGVKITTPEGSKIVSVIIKWKTGQPNTPTDWSKSGTSSPTTFTPNSGINTNEVSFTRNSSANFLAQEITVNYETSSSGSGSEETVASVTLTPNAKDFGTVNVGDNPSQEFTITTENTTATLTASIDDDTNYAVSAITGNKVTVTYQPQSADTHTAVLTIKAGEEATATVNLTGKAVQALEGTWILVTDASSLKAGDEIIIAAKDYNVALSTTQKSNNRGEVEITKTDNTITATSEAQVLTLQTGTKEGTLALSTGAGYLYAASTSDNHLKTETELSDNSSWVITIENGVASLTAQGTNTRNVMQYNQSSKLFACYSSASQKAIAIYKNTNGQQVAGLAYATTKYLTKLGDAFATPALTNPNSLAVTYSSSDNNVATVAADGVVTIKAAGVVKITATFEETESYLGGSASYTIGVTEHAGTQADPYSVADAKRVIDVMETAENVYATGIISQIDSYNSTYNSITYWISADGTTTSQMQVYGGLAGTVFEKFTSKDNLKTGDEVVIKGNLKLHNGSVYEFDANNELVSLVRNKAQADLAYAETELTANVGEDFAEPTLSNPYSLSITYSSSNTTLATVNATTGEVTILAAGKVTITASSAADATYAAGSASYNITISDPSLAVATLPFYFDGKRVDIEGTAGMTQSNLGSDYAAVPYLKFNAEGAWAIVQFDSEPGEFSFLLKQNGESIGTFTVYESENGEDYTPIWSGGDLGGNAKSATIEPTLSATARYVKFEYTTKPTGTNYGLGEISIKKADHRQESGLAWNPAAVSLTVGDAFTAPTFTNPNGLSGITFASSNEELATVNNAGAITLVSGKTGTATITATFADGHADYKPAEATCVITVSPKSEKVVILAQYNGQWYALQAAYFSTYTNRLAALPVNYVGGKLYNVEEADKATIEWQLAISATKATFKNGENYLTGTNGTDLKLGTATFEWDYNGELFLTDGDSRTFIYHKDGYFRNYATTNAIPNSTTYSNKPVVTAPVYDTAIEIGSGDNTTVIEANENQKVNVIVDRAFEAGDEWYTLCVPFNMPASLIGTAYQLSSLIQKDAEYVEVNLAAKTTIEAGKPYLVKPNVTVNKFVVENVTIVNTTGESIAKSINGLAVAMQGVINGGGTTEDLYWVGNSGYLYNDNVTKSGLRTYFDITTSSSIAPRMRVVAGENVETGLEDLFSTDAPAKLIENGQLIIIRDGVKYNVQGQKL